MSAQQKKISFAGTNPGEHCKYIELSVTTSTIGTMPFSAYSAFGETYGAAPRVLGCNGDDPEATVTAKCTTTGITIWVRSDTRTNLPDGVVLASAFIHGALA
jgi:hypothetical protein